MAIVACAGSPPSRPLAIGEPAPAFELSKVGGGTVALEDLAGQPRVLVFWATWCQPCLAEIPGLEAVEKQHPGTIVSIALDEGGAADVARFLEKRPLPYRVLIGDADLFARYDGLAIPHTVVLDSDLRVVAVHRGIVGAEALEHDLAGLRPSS